MLDGANERGAWEAAERLLYNFHQHGSELRTRVRVLFTSRPLEHRPKAGRHFWGDARIIQVGPFNDAEFAAAMAKFASDARPEALTAAVRELARVPRYFQLSASAGESSRRPMVLAWRESDEHRLRLAKQTKRNRAAIGLFWAHWGNSSSNRENISLAGRKLREYCRGERLQDGVSSRMAPWWEVP